MSRDRNQKLLEAADSLEALAFLVQDLNANLLSHLTLTRNRLLQLSKAQRKDLLKALEEEIRILRSNFGALASNSWFREMYTDFRSRLQYSYISKLNIDQKMFRFYDKVFPRWRHMKEHALVVFDGKTNSTTGQVYEIEDALYQDATLLLRHAREMHEGIKDFRARSRERQLRLFSYLRSATMALFGFLEAYLNGLAFDCFHLHQTSLPMKTRDLLSEWNSKQQRRSFVPFHKKVFRYPAIIAKLYGKELDLSSCTPARRIGEKGKMLRDALAHPSPFTDIDAATPAKLPLVMTLDIIFIEELHLDSRNYVETVERGIGKDPQQSAPWLYRYELD